MKVLVSPRAIRDLRKVPLADARAILGKLEAFAAHGTGDVRKLTGRNGFRLRHGQWRALFTVEDELIVLRVLHRREAYR